ncbi:MAG: LysR family transcriptional regulator [Rhodobacteraceae bacterium]|nr:LysR family transcriptional regulator [Paracoccaceae bacterium]
MDIVDQLKSFVATAQTGSFTAAADQLGVSNRLTSKYVAELEARLGVRLFQRTTRKVGLTPAGENLLSRAPALLDDLDDLLAEVGEGSSGMSGLIRVSAPVTFGEVYVNQMLGRFARQNPGLSFDLRLSDRFVDLAADGIDIAFRIGTSNMLSLKSKKLGSISSALVASPKYIEQFGTPKTFADLSDHSCIIDTNRRSPRRWVFQENGSEVVVNVQGRFHVNSANAAVCLATDGLGIAYAPHFALIHELESGELISLFEDFNGDSSSLSAVYLEGRILPLKIRALIDFAVKDAKTAGIF